MINKVRAQMYCAEPIELIENYDKAVADNKRVWHCHHVWETMLEYTAEELIEMNEYYGIPAKNLIFLTPTEHTRLHKTGSIQKEESKTKISESLKGEKNPFYGKHHSEETKQIIREKNFEWHKHNKPANLGIPHTEETKKKMSEVKIGNNYGAKPIIQYSLDGEFVKEWSSASEIQRQLGFKTACISRCARGERHHSYNYIWKFKI